MEDEKEVVRKEVISEEGKRSGHSWPGPGKGPNYPKESKPKPKTKPK